MWDEVNSNIESFLYLLSGEKKLILELFIAYMLKTNSIHLLGPLNLGLTLCYRAI